MTLTTSERPTPMTTPAPAADLLPDIKLFRGSFLLFRKEGERLRKLRTTTARAPRFRHPNFESATSEAKRLLEIYPESTFVILQEVGRIKLTAMPSRVAA